MSLLLNALKKAEEGEKEGAVDSQDSSVEGQESVSSSENINVESRVETADTVETAAPATAAADAPPAVVSGVDFDSIVSEQPETVADDVASQVKDKAQRVDAARVFGASDSRTSGGVADGGGLIKKLGMAIAGIGIVGAGGFGALSFGLIPGADLSTISELFGGEQNFQPVADVGGGPTNDIGSTLEASGDLVLLPVPSTDVQSEIDFAALLNPENRRENLGDEAYAEKIAILTGYEIGEEQKKRREEEQVLMASIKIGEDSAQNDISTDTEVEGSGVDSEQSVIQSATDNNQTSAQPEEILYTAEISRQEKQEIDQQTFYDEMIAVNLNSESSAGANVQVEVEEQKVAEIVVNSSGKSANRMKQLEKATSLYYNGSYQEAEIVYRNILEESPTNKNALRGLAQLAIATGRYQSAVATYLQILRYYPNDSVAIAELTNLKPSTGDEFYDVERLLRGALDQEPDTNARIHFALGNLYAENGLWIKSQQSYFNAFSTNSNNPDYAYNLAVVLDYLDKPSLAVQYYKIAVELSEGIKVGFNRSEVQARIRDLTQ